jgi:hypothetical protein
VAAMAAAGAGVVDRGLERSYQRMGIAHQVGRSKGPTEIMLFLVFFKKNKFRHHLYLYLCDILKKFS